MYGERSSSEWKRGKAQERDVYLNTNYINPMFDPNRVLLCRIFFIDPEKTNISLWDSIRLEIINL